MFTRPLKPLISAVLLAGILTGCAGSTNGPPLPGLPDRVELTGVPFFRGEEYQGSSMALASLLALQGVRMTPGLLEPTLHLPDDTDHLATHVPDAAREFGLMVYPLDPSLNALLTQVAAGYPVLLRYQAGSMLWSEPRYAVLIGYDRYKRHVLLRSGEQRRQLLDFDSFAAAWKGAGSWAALVLQPGQLPAQVDRQRWLQAADQLGRAGHEQAASAAVRAIDAR
jgi:hypothetical protein